MMKAEVQAEEMQAAEIKAAELQSIGRCTNIGYNSEE
jgi:hypothetical protein